MASSIVGLVAGLSSAGLTLVVMIGFVCWRSEVKKKENDRRVARGRFVPSRMPNL